MQHIEAAALQHSRDWVPEPAGEAKRVPSLVPSVFGITLPLC